MPTCSQRNIAARSGLVEGHPEHAACGFKLANDGHDTRILRHYLGHKNVQHAVRYTEMVLPL
jgi:type 1 fimbriae regulatory protein FimB/type 1 fimbriae regulatory protein FimE